MKHKIFVAVVCLLVSLGLSGCQLAQPDESTDAGKDRLAGVFVTTEYLDLFDADSFMRENIRGAKNGELVIDGDAGQYRGRLYAELQSIRVRDEETGASLQTADYVFPLEGISFFSARVPATEDREGYLTTISDPAISDGHVAYHTKDDGESVTLTGTIYVIPGSTRYYFNPVYQSADGSVYAVSGDAFMLDSEWENEGGVFSTKLEDEFIISQGGKEEKKSSTITLAISYMFAPEKIAVLQMDEHSVLVSREEYAPDAVPDSISVEPEAAYLIVETYKADAMQQIKVSRKIYSKEDENLETFSARPDGVCVKNQAHIIW